MPKSSPPALRGLFGDERAPLPMPISISTGLGVPNSAQFGVWECLDIESIGSTINWRCGCIAAMVTQENTGDQFETTIRPAGEGMAFYQDVQGSLPAVHPLRPGSDRSVVPPQVEGWSFTRRPSGGSRGPRCIIEIVPPHAVVFGEARFVDEQESAFKTWQHSHEFEAIDSKTAHELIGLPQVGWGRSGGLQISWWCAPNCGGCSDIDGTCCRSCWGRFSKITRGALAAK
jgi:hypothetical protein